MNPDYQNLTLKNWRSHLTKRFNSVNDFLLITPQTHVCVYRKELKFQLKLQESMCYSQSTASDEIFSILSKIICSCV